jgi:acetyl esterase
VEELATGSRAKPLCLALSVLAGAIVLAAAIGTLLPDLPLIGLTASVVTGFFALHVVLIAVLGGLLALLARHLGAGTTAIVMMVLNAIAAIVLLVPLTSQVSAAHRAGATISWTAHLRMVAAGPRPVPARTAQYAVVDGKTLALDIYEPTHRSTDSPSTPVVMIHGGGFLYGHRSDGRDWDRWFAERGYTVFDVDYRLSPPVTWNLAAEDVACALSWIRQHQQELHVASTHTLIVGQSAGASLALQVAYGIGDSSIKSSCEGGQDTPVAVFALYPAEDFALAWKANLKLGPVHARSINSEYIGGSPEQFPDRYRVVSAIEHVRPGLPATMIAYGARDHLVPVAGHVELYSRLMKLGIPSVLLEIPYSDHGYDLVWGSLGAQITRHDLTRFLSAYCPSTPAHAR